MRLVSAGLDQLRQAPPGLSDYPVLLVQGTERRDESPFSLYQRACEQGWMTACERLALAYLEGQGVAQNAERAATVFEKACVGGVPTACASLGYQFRQGIGVAADQVRSIQYLKKACGLDMAAACRWLSEACHESGPADANVLASACE
jgi:TPR repeat protein